MGRNIKCFHSWLTINFTSTFANIFTLTKENKVDKIKIKMSKIKISKYLRLEFTDNKDFDS